jgi:phenylpropionate dioxygenase-like ring-hydroxylating dioxygenase large terminal subunit
MTLPGRYYTDPEIFRREVDRFYFGRWICAGRASAIPNAGDYFLCEIADESVIVLRATAGEVRPFYNVCRHRGTRMCTERQGSLAGCRITCPYQFSLRTAENAGAKDRFLRKESVLLTTLAHPPSDRWRVTC